MKTDKDSIVSLLQFLTQTTSLLIFIFMVFKHLYQLVAPSENYLSQYAFSQEELRELFLIGYFLAIMGWYIAWRTKKIQFISPLALPWIEKATLVISSVLLAMLYEKLFSAIFLLLFFTFILSVPQIVNSYMQLKYADIKSAINKLRSITE
ncbi:hypothetical protein A2866_04020 [Candidatus Roizmanbacteria bacterium RIFCSPHIGHO2_01_FULL_39_8]|uniref:Uncharacterized protein n=3 Tax=Candidatus Roizmaniibacteriota TaxID=1752723 RepID=A0A1F7GQB1_9BACT|nr:MAG: hypothetical protein A2866_04020 [Candidatus Roizmanbacteria bacterium RIFCSPHIGHO2_01_FULL_39_8]OGK26610.1 MAG: hypothetical protein A3C28_03840 [Candidatus Roizmanbacteria bacterium RIFCSPHIGHO2_02_FULL_39_9]OGK35174.1 MAG: hypothetical protein A3F60_02790 [Candidatus Roizmanbacteria bacterium RIFCSPHIGHO2_12_FULL_39_8]